MTSIGVTIAVFRNYGEILSNQRNLGLMRFQGSGILFKVTWNFYVSWYNKFILNLETAYIELDNCQST
jgi:hypothetical protein